MNCREVAQRLTEALDLDLAPVSLSFFSQAPEGIPEPPREVPSACSFWRDAEKGTFYASAESHFNCPIGAMVMGFSLPDHIRQKLGELVGAMSEHSYLSPDEAGAIPVVNRAPAGIIYGPLAESTTPDVVLLWVSPLQAMLCNEAMGAAKWTTSPPTVTGRPGCAALPLAMSSETPTLSFGCAGMRTFTGVSDARLLVAVPGDQLESFAGALEGTIKSNAPMHDHYREQRARFTAASQGGH